jgi:hypothetical protein
VHSRAGLEFVKKEAVYITCYKSVILHLSRRNLVYEPTLTHIHSLTNLQTNFPLIFFSKLCRVVEEFI